MEEKTDILIKGGIIVDGSGSEPYEADIGVSGDRITFIDRNSEAGIQRHTRVIDARGLTVTPGFIDTHSHSEFTLIADPRAEGKIWQGITTEINGNCGLSAAPLSGEAVKQREADLMEFDIREKWSTFKEYFGLLEKTGISLNFVTLAGHGNIRASVSGYKDIKLTASDRERMHFFLAQAIGEGAIGLSTGLIYPPGVYSDTDELIDLCNALTRSYRKAPVMESQGVKFLGSGIYASHMRSEGDNLIESIEEILRIAKEAGVRVHISHIKTSGEKNWHKIDGALQSIEAARTDGAGVTCDRYPYTASSTDLDTVLPSWAYEGGVEEEIRKLTNDKNRERLKKEVLSEHPEMRYWESIYVSSVSSEKNRWTEGKSIAFIAHQKNCDPVDMFFKILIEEKLRVGAIFSSMSENNLKKFLSRPYVMIGTDSSARSADGPTCRGKPHPRGFGSFPRFLGRYVRDDSLLNLSEAIHKITTLPADTFGIHKRGVLKRGAFADIVVLDYEKIGDRATFDEPFLKPEGIQYVIVNGAAAVWEGESTGLRAGRVLRHGR
jgi:N-acyl-D-amino-acid deacylase